MNTLCWCLLICSSDDKKIESAESLCLWKSEIGTRSGRPVKITPDYFVIGSNNSYVTDFKRNDAGVVSLYSIKNEKKMSELFFDRLPTRGIDLPNSPINGSIAVSDLKIYFMNNRSEVICGNVNADSKLSISWNVDLKKNGVQKYTYEDYFNMLPGLTLFDDNLLVNTSHRAARRQLVPILINFDPKNGSVKWKVDINSSNLVSALAAPLVYERNKQKIVIAATGPHTIDFLDLATGNRIIESLDLGLFLFNNSSRKSMPDDVFVTHLGIHRSNLIINCSCAVDSNTSPVDLLVVNLNEIFSKQAIKPHAISLRDYGNCYSAMTFNKDNMYLYTNNGYVLCYNMINIQLIKSISLEFRNKTGAVTIYDDMAYIPVLDRLMLYKIKSNGELVYDNEILFNSELISDNPLITENAIIISTDRHLWMLKKR